MCNEKSWSYINMFMYDVSYKNQRLLDFCSGTFYNTVFTEPVCSQFVGRLEHTCGHKSY